MTILACVPILVVMLLGITLGYPAIDQLGDGDLIATLPAMARPWVVPLASTFGITAVISTCFLCVRP